MSDQPKPATGKQESAIPGWNVDGTKRDQPKPATGEWMASTVEIMFMANPKNAHYAIADAHNAAIADAYEKGMKGGIKATGIALAAAQPNPTTGEWTMDDVCEIVGESPVFGAEAIVTAHNAALAAAWRKGHADAQEPALKRIDELHQQLAAKTKAFMEYSENGTAIIKDLREQLVAEREKWLTANAEELFKFKELQEQLAAEREMVQALTAVLKRTGEPQKNWIRAEDNPGFHRHE